MKVIKTISEMAAWSREIHRAGKTIGFVPTMGYLHEGHLSLIRRAKALCDFTVVSIYVNPTQFAPHEDLARYPRDFERDEQLCRSAATDVIFYPETREIYQPDHFTFVGTEKMTGKLCGLSRPHHFRGVTTIVAKLFNIVQPDCAVFGQKDAQQALIIKKMVSDLNFPVQIDVAPIVREEDGLAMSSRNKFLDSKQRQEAASIYQTLQYVAAQYRKEKPDFNQLKKEAANFLNNRAECQIDYIEFLDAENLEPPAADRPVLMAVAVYFGQTRLIDNIVLS